VLSFWVARTEQVESSCLYDRGSHVMLVVKRGHFVFLVSLRRHYRSSESLSPGSSPDRSKSASSSSGDVKEKGCAGCFCIGGKKTKKQRCAISMFWGIDLYRMPCSILTAHARAHTRTHAYTHTLELFGFLWEKSCNCGHSK